MTTRYGTPETVAYCARCVMSNQRPSSVVERANTGQPKPTLGFVDGVCDACAYQDHIDHRIDWQQRDAELRALCDRYRSKDGSPDCIVPGSGGKDSWFAACVLAERYGMHPLTVTWAPMIWTDVGRRNYERWSSRFAHRLMERDEATHRKLTRLAFENLCHPFQPFIVGQRHCAAKVAIETGIELCFYGEDPAQYAGPVDKNYDPRMPREFYAADETDPMSLVLAGMGGRDLLRNYDMGEWVLGNYAPVSNREADALGLDFRYLGHYLPWNPQAVYYCAAERGFECNERRTEGTFSRYSSIDDKMDTLHYYSTLMKFGIGRCSYDASQEVRWGHRTRAEAVGLVRRYDGEFPALYFAECCEYMGLSTAEVGERLNEARAPHLWEKRDGQWALRRPVWEAS